MLLVRPATLWSEHRCSPKTPIKPTKPILPDRRKRP